MSSLLVKSVDCAAHRPCFLFQFDQASGNSQSGRRGNQMPGNPDATAIRYRNFSVSLRYVVSPLRRRLSAHECLLVSVHASVCAMVGE